MNREHFGRMFGHLQRALRKDERLTKEEFNQLLQLSEAIIEYGRMIQEFYRYSSPIVILETTELANRFRETPQAIKDALLLLGKIGRAEPADLEGCWKLRLADNLRGDRKGFESVMRDHSMADNNGDLGAA